MRVTQSMLTSNMLKNLSRSFEKLAKYQDQLSSQKKITRPSDDPVVAMKGISYRRHLQEVVQYKRNFSEAYNWLDQSDAALDKAGKALQRIRELLVQASNDTYDEQQRVSVSEEIAQLREHLAEIANTKVGDKYLFNGTNTLERPVDLETEPVTVSTNGKPVQIELSKGIYITVNVKPQDVFSEDLFHDIEGLALALNDENADGELLSGFLEKIDRHLNNVLNARADLGSRVNRVEMMEQRIEEQETLATKMMSDNEDVDFEKVVTDLLAQESAHRAALAAGARIMQSTLMDFLR